MIKYINNTLNSTTPNTVTLKYLVAFAIVAVIYLILKNANAKYTVMPEGFSQEAPFVLKRDDNIYDEFYVDMYEELKNTKDRGQWELLKILKMTEPSTKHSVFLDVGSATGYTVNELQDAGYRAFGVDKSKAMVDYSAKKYPEIEVKCSDVNDSMLFDRSTFTHVLCTNFTIYEMQDKMSFFRNCYYWMMPNGYLIIHLVDHDKFNAVSPLHKDEIKWMPFFKPEFKQKTDVDADYADYKYKVGYNIPKNVDESCKVLMTETFTDKETPNVRQNEQTLYMENITKILEMAARSGFIVHGKVNMKDYNDEENQYLYILERQL